MPEANFETVATHLNKMGLDASVEHTGGNIYCIFVRLGNSVEMVFGTSGEVWGASIYINEEYTDMDVWADCSSETGNSVRVARSLKRAVENFLIGQ